MAVRSDAVVCLRRSTGTVTWTLRKLVAQETKASARFFTLDTAGAELQEGSTGVFSAGQRRRRQSELSVCVVSAGFKDETCPPVAVPHSTQKGFSAACNAGRDDNFESFESAPPGYRIQK